MPVSVTDAQFGLPLGYWLAAGFKLGPPMNRASHLPAIVLRKATGYARIFRLQFASRYRLTNLFI